MGFEEVGLISNGKSSACVYRRFGRVQSAIVVGAIRKQSKSCINRLKKYPSIRLRTEGSCLSTNVFAENIGFLCRFCRPASGKCQDRYYVFTTVAEDRKRAVPNSLIEKGVGSPG